MKVTRPPHSALAPFTLSAIVCVLGACGPSGDIRLFPTQASVESPPSSKRDPVASPYATSSIWNTALGEQASLAPVMLARATAGIRGEAVVVLLDAGAEPLSVEHSDAAWSGADRCPPAAPAHFRARAPGDFLVLEGKGKRATPLVAVQDDGYSLKQGLPFVRCTPNAPATIAFEESASDLYGDGIDGANGGSGMSALGGLLRLGELLPDAEPPRHVLAVHVWGQENLWNASSDEECFRWPASRGDSSCTDGYGGTQPELRMGALLALPQGRCAAASDGRGSEARLDSAKLWSLVVNDAGSPSYAFNIELSPNGWVAEEFQRAWGFPFQTSDLASDRARDLQAIFDALVVVADNDPSTPGGAGARRQPPLTALDER